MQKRLPVLLLALVCLLVGLGAGAGVQARDTYQAYAHGMSSCGAYTSSQGSERYDMDVWLAGFVSGAGYAGTERLSTTDIDAMSAYVANYCQTNPLDHVAAAAGALVKELQRRARSSSR